ncbi:hypothetical protein ABZ769_08055 [Streptomyces olivoreticuli]
MTNDDTQGRIRRDGTRKRAILTTGKSPRDKHASNGPARGVTATPTELIEMACRRHGKTGAWELRQLKRLGRDDPPEFTRLLNEVRMSKQ